VFIEAKDDGGGGNNWSYKTCKAPVKSSQPTNQHLVFFTGQMSFLSPNFCYYKHAHIRFNGHFPGKPALSGCFREIKGLGAKFYGSDALLDADRQKYTPGFIFSAFTTNSFIYS